MNETLLERLVQGSQHAHQITEFFQTNISFLTDADAFLQTLVENDLNGDLLWHWCGSLLHTPEPYRTATLKSHMRDGADVIWEYLAQIMNTDGLVTGYMLTGSDLKCILAGGHAWREIKTWLLNTQGDLDKGRVEFKMNHPKKR